MVADLSLSLIYHLKRKSHTRFRGTVPLNSLAHTGSNKQLLIKQEVMSIGEITYLLPVRADKADRRKKVGEQTLLSKEFSLRTHSAKCTGKIMLIFSPNININGRMQGLRN
jgi:hypothetical protein